MFEKMPADAPDAHIYQLPDAPPPPKLPPPPLNPPLSLEPLLPEYEPPPPDQPPPPPDQLPRLPLKGVALSANMVMRNATSARMIAAARDPATNHASPPTMLPIATPPIRRPN